MGIALELLMVTDKDISDLLRMPAGMSSFLETNWSPDESQKERDARHSLSIWNIYDEVDFVLRAGRPDGELPLGFLQARPRLIKNTVEHHRMEIGGEIVEWDQDEMEYGPPYALLSDEVTQVSDALGPVDDEWVQKAYDPDQVMSANARERLTPSDLDERIRACQESVRELRQFILQTAAKGLGLILFLW